MRIVCSLLGCEGMHSMSELRSLPRSSSSALPLLVTRHVRFFRVDNFLLESSKLLSSASDRRTLRTTVSHSPPHHQSPPPLINSNRRGERSSGTQRLVMRTSRCARRTTGCRIRRRRIGSRD